MKLRLRNLLFALAAAACLAGGCIRPGLPPAVDLKISGLDTAVLKGKTIIIDPGHGGPERGAIAQNGLNEAEVNLGVALYLWGFFKQAGANPILTRSSDTSIFKGEPFVLRSDLEARAAFSNAQKADLFISVHHNSDGKEQGEHNDLIIFFRMADPGCSRDVAREVCAALKSRMQAEPASTRPGNYLVLRSTRAAAILGEASYMNYKQNTEKLAYHRTLATEAQGYFLGVLNYYAKGVPSIEFITPPAAPFATAQPVIAARLTAGAPGAALDRDSLRAMLDGRGITSLAVDMAAGTVSYTPDAPLANATHELCLDIRNTAGNAAKKECLIFTVAVPPARLSMQPVFTTIPADGESEAPLDIFVFDGLGRPVMDGTQLELSATAGKFAAATVATKNGRARAFLISDKNPQHITVTVKAGEIKEHCQLSFGTPQEALFMAEIKDATGKPVEGAALVRGKREVSLSDAAGRVFDCVEAGGAAGYIINRKGYEPLQVSAALTAGKLQTAAYSLQAIDGGVYFNRIVLLDAAGQSQEALPLLRELKNMIEHAGGTALLTWENLPAPPVQSRVMKAAEAKADLFLSVANNKAATAEYYYKSDVGAQLADLVCRGLNERKAFGKKTCEPSPGTDYVLMQTSMTALLLHLPATLNIPTRDAAASLYGAIGKMFEKSNPGM